MAAPQRVPDTKVLAAIERWRGNVTAAAEELRMKPRNLRKRLDTLRVDLPALRGLKGATGPTPIGPHRPSSTPMKGATRIGGLSSLAPIASARTPAPNSLQSHAGPYPKPAVAPTFMTVQNGVALMSAGGDEGVRIRRQAAQPRIPPDVLDRIGKLRRRLQAELDADLTDGDLIEMATAEGVLDAWVESKIAAIRESRPAEGGEDR
jgi:hypothetical protein